MGWSPRGCLFAERQGVFCRSLLCPSSSNLYRLLEAGSSIGKNSTASTRDRTELIRSIRRLRPMCSWSTEAVFSRALHEALYDFEQILNRDYTPDLHSMAIGVMFIISKTFREFVHSTVIEEGSHGNILTLDPNSKFFTIIAPGTFLDMKFVLDFEAVFNETPPPGLVSFTPEEVLFAALRACVRSAVFQLSFDSADLLDFVGRMEDVVYVSAIPDVPHS